MPSHTHQTKSPQQANHINHITMLVRIFYGRAPTETCRERKSFRKEGGQREEIMTLLKQIQNSVSKFEITIPVLLSYLQGRCKRFRAGQAAKHFTAWTEITNDKEILSDISGVSIECMETPMQHNLPSNNFQTKEYHILDKEIQKLLDKGVIVKVQYNTDQFISSIFLRPKNDGSHCRILNLKKFNESVSYHHFKMESINITKLVSKGCFMASLDLKDAYYSIPIKSPGRKFLCFKWQGQVYQFTCLPNGLSCAPRKFTKILKPALATLHS